MILLTTNRLHRSESKLNKIRRVGPQSSTIIVLCPQGSDVRTSLVAVETEESKSMNITPLVKFLRKLEDKNIQYTFSGENMRLLIY